MKTYRINKEDLKNKEVLAEGYKIFNQGFKARDYCYADEKGQVIGTFHRVDGDIEECKWGLHFSKNPFHCFNFYECVQWNEFAKVRAYERIIDSQDGKKAVAQVLEIVETYGFDEFLEILKEYNKQQYLSDGINNSYGINNSNGINYSRGINNSYGINNSNGINYSRGINNSYGINYSRGINNSYGINYSDGINNSYGIVNSEAVSQSLFCYDFTGKYGLFNKIVSPKRIQEVKNEIYQFSWYPNFNNAFEMKNGKEDWFKVNIPNIFEIDNKTAWSIMPKDMKKYIQKLPEYDEEIFNKITGDLEND